MIGPMERWVPRARHNLKVLEQRAEGLYAVNEYDYGHGIPEELTDARRKIGQIRERLRTAGELR